MSVTTALRLSAIVAALAVLPAAGHAQTAAPATSHREHGQSQPPRPAAPDPHAHHQQPREGGVPPITDEDRKAAFPDVRGHTVHDSGLNYVVTLDRIEWQAGGNAAWNSSSWVGGDRNRMWLRSEGHTEDGRLEAADVQVLYGRAVARWWDVVAGVRQDFRPGPARTWAAFGIQGLAPYWFEVAATAYVGGDGRTAARLEVEYDLLLTNRLMLQPLVEMNLAGKRDLERGIGAGLVDADVGLRLRYEVRREIAPYAGVEWSWKAGETADLARRRGEATSGARLVAGVRLWF